MKVTMTLNKLGLLNNTLYKLVQREQRGNPRFLFTAKNNTDRLREMMKNAAERQNEIITPEFQAYANARDAIYEKYRTEHGIKGNDFGAFAPQVEQEVLALANEPQYKDAIAKHAEDSQELHAMFAEEIEVELKPFDMKVLPKTMALIDFVSIEPIIEHVNEFKPHEVEAVSITTNNLVTMVEMLLGMRESKLATEKFSIAVCRRLNNFIKAAKPIYEEFVELRSSHSSVPEFAKAQTDRNDILKEMQLEAQKIHEKDIDEAQKNEELSAVSTRGMERINQIMVDMPQEALDKIKKIDDEIVEYGAKENSLLLSAIRLEDLPDDADFAFLDLFSCMIRE